MPTAVRRCLPALLQPMKRGPQPHSTPPPRLSPSSTPHLALLPTLLISLLVAHRLQQPLSYDEEVEETGEMSGAAAGRSGGRSSSTPRPQRWTERRPLGWTPSLPSFLGSLGSVGCCAVLSAAQLLGRCCGASPASSTVQCQTPLEGVVPPHLRGWPHEGAAASVDCAGVRRGFEVYRQVCSACHSLQYLHYRQLVGVSHTEEQAKALARSVRVIDGPDEEGQMVERPASLADALPSPYPNEQFARSANNGALPPDLSLIGRRGHEDYVFALLTAYHDAPYGVQLKAYQHYNTYFPSNLTLMPSPLVDGGVEYEDGTVASVSQQAKDVAEFLSWTSEPLQDERKKAGLKAALLAAVVVALVGHRKRLLFSPYHTRKIRWHHPDHPMR